MFREKRKILEDGIDAYLAATEAGYITCLKTLYSEIEGIVRIRYMEEAKRSPSFKELADFVREKANNKFGARGSLGFPDVFYRYLNETVFQSFDLATGQIDLSRHSVSHGVAGPTKYTRDRAIQAILTLDQMYFYLV